MKIQIQSEIVASHRFSTPKKKRIKLKSLKCSSPLANL